MENPLVNQIIVAVGAPLILAALLWLTRAAAKLLHEIKVIQTRQIQIESSLNTHMDKEQRESKKAKKKRRREEKDLKERLTILETGQAEMKEALESLDSKIERRNSNLDNREDRKDGSTPH